jgi:hypothetical protein
VLLFYYCIYCFFCIHILSIAQNNPCIKPPGSLLNTCQLFSTRQSRDGSWQLINSNTKYNTPLGTRIAANRLKTSYTRTQVHKNHPTGSILFPGASSLAQMLDDFLSSLENVEENYEKRFAQGKDNYFIVYFSRIQLTVLHALYQYLLTIYTTCNLSHIETLQAYFDNETKQALNKKTMIINHLINIIESQANSAIVMRFPNIPQHLATRIGPMMMKQDYGADLNLMIAGEEIRLFTDIKAQQYYQKRRELYSTILGKYLKLFKNYTATLDQADKQYGTIFTQHATHIYTIMSAQTPLLNKQGSAQNMIESLRTIKTINPPLFFYTQETLRGLRLIQQLSNDLPVNSEKISWPSALIEHASKGTPITDRFGNVMSNQPRAYFLTNQGAITKSVSNAAQLFVNIPTAENMYTQEVKMQPSWLNTPQGVLCVLRACLGDYMALFDPLLKEEKILDPCLSCIILNAGIAANLVGNESEKRQACADCDWYLEQLRKMVQETPDNTTIPPVQSPDNPPEPFSPS